MSEMSDDYNVFISWSGDRSKWVGDAIHEWLPQVVHAARPFISADIDKGARGLPEISAKLSAMKVGIFCLASDNLDAPWIHYEAGALAKTIDDKTRLCTYLLGGLKFQDITGPLAMFQATNPDRADTLKLVQTINRAVSKSPVSEIVLNKGFDVWWPKLESEMAKMPTLSEPVAKQRPIEDMVAEILEIARAERNNAELAKAQISEISEILQRSPYGNLALSAYSSARYLSAGPTPLRNILTGNALDWADSDTALTATLGETISEKDSKK